jgi:hypothetical protein
MRRAADTVNYANIGLMLVSCVAAYVVPFELFLFSYAVLGPLHYLTEISWLHDRNYFTTSGAAQGSGKAQRYWLALVLVTLALMMYGLVAERILRQPFSPVYEIGLFYAVFVSAFLLVFIKNRAISAAAVGLTALWLVVWSSSRSFGLVAFFLITIVHVFAFTAAFVLFGALKGRSISGLLSLFVFVLCAASFFVFVPGSFGSAAGEYVRHSYGSFQTLNAELIKLFHLGTGTSLSEIYDSTAGLMVMRLIAFAYTYHYLNWFSKTSIIKWHAISKSRAVVIGMVWLCSVGIYAYSYDVGMTALYFLSVLHVMLEFPLDHQTFAGIAKELSGLVMRPASGVPRASQG